MTHSGQKSIILISGKRKSGKDFVANLLQKSLSTQFETRVVHLSEPLKSDYAIKNQLNLDALLSSGPLKEEHRKAMVDYGESVRQTDPWRFCRRAMAPFLGAIENGAKIVIVADVRRRSDLAYFESLCEENQNDVILVKLRIWAGNYTRTQRGWIYTHAIDDCETECDLDNFNGWHCVVCNDFDHFDECFEEFRMMDGFKGEVVRVKEVVDVVERFIVG